MSGWINGAKNDGGGGSSLVRKSVRLMSRGDERRGRGRQQNWILARTRGTALLNNMLVSTFSTTCRVKKLPTNRLFKRMQKKRGELSRTSQCYEELWNVALVESDHLIWFIVVPKSQVIGILSPVSEMQTHCSGGKLWLGKSDSIHTQKNCMKSAHPHREHNEHRTLRGPLRWRGGWQREGRQFHRFSN